MGAYAETGSATLAAAEAALARGESEQAFAAAERAAALGVPHAELHRLANAFGLAARFTNRQPVALRWIEGALADASDVVETAKLLAARIAVCRQIDVKRVLTLADEALAAAERASDDDSYATVLGHAAFAAYRTGDARRATMFADAVANRPLSSKLAQYHARRAEMFAATARSEPERSLALSREARDLALDLNMPADAGNESNNLAETLLELGRPKEARDEATVAAELAIRAGHRQVEAFARVLMAVATAETGNVDPALDLLRTVETLAVNPMLAMDGAAAESFWLLERGAAGDVGRARDVALAALDVAERTGARNRLTTLWAQVARSYARLDSADEARAALERARNALDATEPSNEAQLALAFAEVLPVGDPQRRTALTAARNRILRGATKRENPELFCVNVRLHRRLLELSGGVPADLLA